jgi:hypothetical protein
MEIAWGDRTHGLEGVETRCIEHQAAAACGDADDCRFDAERRQRGPRLLEQSDEPLPDVPKPDQQQRNLHDARAGASRRAAA